MALAPAKRWADLRFTSRRSGGVVTVGDGAAISLALFDDEGARAVPDDLLGIRTRKRPPRARRVPATHRARVRQAAGWFDTATVDL
jgi:hypothetical protein